MNKRERNDITVQYVIRETSPTSSNMYPEKDLRSFSVWY